MKILVLNSGSSSLKFKLFDMKNNLVICSGVCEKVGDESSSFFTYKSTNAGKKKTLDIPIKTHQTAFELVIKTLIDSDSIKKLEEIDAVGHRVVHGGEFFKTSTIIDKNSLLKIEELAALAPLHNYPALDTIKACINVFEQNIPQIAVFDTSFYQTLPQKAYFYPIPYDYYKKYKIRKYGFHGISHEYVAKRAAELLKKNLNSLKIITCHLGNGSSLTAIDKSRAIDTSMGFTPLDGVMMGTRSGSIDPAIVTYLGRKENLSFKQIEEILNKKSGLLGVSGVSNDNRDIVTAASKQNKRAELAEEMLIYRIIKNIGSFYAILGGLDALIFTAGIGENTPCLRQKICDKLFHLGIAISNEKNVELNATEGKISTGTSHVKVFIIPTNEELMIAKETLHHLTTQL